MSGRLSSKCNRQLNLSTCRVFFFQLIQVLAEFVLTRRKFTFLLALLFVNVRQLIIFPRVVKITIAIEAIFSFQIQRLPSLHFSTWLKYDWLKTRQIFLTCFTASRSAQSVVMPISNRCFLLLKKTFCQIAFTLFTIKSNNSQNGLFIQQKLPCILVFLTIMLFEYQNAGCRPE